MDPNLTLITPGTTTASAMLNSLQAEMVNIPTETALIILPASILLAIVLNFILTRILLRLADRSETQLDNQAVTTFRIPLYWTFIGLGVFISISALQIIPDLVPITSRVIISLILFIWTHAIAQFSKFAIEDISLRFQDHPSLNESAISFAKTLAIVGIYLIGFLSIISIWGINIGPIIASAGFLGAALAFGAKDYVANFVGGFTILTDKPYKIGDIVVIDNTYKGKVDEIGMRSTRIQTFDKILITVPNNLMVTEAVINETGSDPTARIKLDVGVAYDSDLEKVEAILLELLHQSEYILDDPEPFVRFKAFADSSINVRLYGHVAEGLNKGPATHELIKQIKSRFDQEGIHIPFPQRVVHQIKS